MPLRVERTSSPARGRYAWQHDGVHLLPTHGPMAAGPFSVPCPALGATAPAPAQAAAVAPSLMARLAGLQRLHQGPGRGRRHSSQPALPSSALGSARAKTATSRLHQGSGWRRRPPWPAPPSSAPGSARKPAGSLHQGSGWRRRSQVVTAPPSSAPGLASSAAAAARRRKTCTKEAAVHPLRRRAASTLTTMPRGSKLNLRAPCLARSEEAGARLKSLPRTGHRHLRPCPARSPRPWALFCVLPPQHCRLLPRRQLLPRPRKAAHPSWEGFSHRRRSAFCLKPLFPRGPLPSTSRRPDALAFSSWHRSGASTCC